MQNQNEIWAKIINDARWYDGTPQGLKKLTEHFKGKYDVVNKNSVIDGISDSCPPSVNESLKIHCGHHRCRKCDEIL